LFYPLDEIDVKKLQPVCDHPGRTLLIHEIAFL